MQQRLNEAKSADMKGAYYVGITSTTELLFDFDDLPDQASDMGACNLAQFLSDCLFLKTAIFRTGKNSFHVVAKTDYNPDQWKMAYETVLSRHKLSKNNFHGLDTLHAELSIKYAKTTLRISPKDGRGSPELWRLYKPT